MSSCAHGFVEVSTTVIFNGIDDTNVLIRWALKLQPLIPSEVIADAVQVALAARELDVRASPYDLYAYQQPIGAQTFDPSPILVETVEVSLTTLYLHRVTYCYCY